MQCSEQRITRFRTRKTASLLAYLAYYSHRSHPREQLMELLWPDRDPESGLHSLSTELSWLRGQMDPSGARKDMGNDPESRLFLAGRHTVQLNPARITTDVAGFRAALAAADRNGTNETRATEMAQAVSLYRGELLASLTDEWVLTERDRLAESCFRALRQLVSLCEQSGDLRRAWGYAKEAVRVEPLCEEAHRDLIRLYAALDGPAVALHHYRQIEALLSEELSVAPSRETQALAKSLTNDHRPAASEPVVAPPAIAPPIVPGPSSNGPASRVPMAPEPALSGMRAEVAESPPPVPLPSPTSLTAPRRWTIGRASWLVAAASIGSVFLVTLTADEQWRGSPHAARSVVTSDPAIRHGRPAIPQPSSPPSLKAGGPARPIALKPVGGSRSHSGRATKRSG